MKVMEEKYYEKYDNLYHQLRTEYTDKEIAESFIFPGFSSEETNRMLSDLIKERKKNRSEKEKEEIRQITKKINNYNGHS